MGCATLVEFRPVYAFLTDTTKDAVDEQARGGVTIALVIQYLMVLF